MVRVIVPLFLLAVIATALASPAEEKYTTKYDNVDLDDVLKNERLQKKALQCLLEEGNCTPDLLELKKSLPDALQNECAKCSEKQREGAKKVLKYLIEKKAEEFAKLEKKYDPEGTYRKQYQKMAEKEGLKL